MQIWDYLIRISFFCGLRSGVVTMCSPSLICLLFFCSLPSLRPLMDVNYLPLTDMRIARTFCFTNGGQALYLSSPTEIQRITYSQEMCDNLQVSTAVCYLSVTLIYKCAYPFICDMHHFSISLFDITFGFWTQKCIGAAVNNQVLIIPTLGELTEAVEVKCHTCHVGFELHWVDCVYIVLQCVWLMITGSVELTWCCHSAT